MSRKPTKGGDQPRLRKMYILPKGPLINSFVQQTFKHLLCARHCLPLEKKEQRAKNYATTLGNTLLQNALISKSDRGRQISYITYMWNRK